MTGILVFWRQHTTKVLEWDRERDRLRRRERECDRFFADLLERERECAQGLARDARPECDLCDGSDVRPGGDRLVPADEFDDWLLPMPEDVVLAFSTSRVTSLSADSVLFTVVVNWRGTAFFFEAAKRDHILTYRDALEIIKHWSWN